MRTATVWEQVLQSSVEIEVSNFLGEWFATTDEFEGVCVADRGSGSARHLKLQSHDGTIRVVKPDCVTSIDEPPTPQTQTQQCIDLGEPEVGDRVTWKSAPSWWNSNGERLSEIVCGYGVVEYWRNPIPYAQLRVTIKALFTGEVDA